MHRGKQSISNAVQCHFYISCRDSDRYVAIGQQLPITADRAKCVVNSICLVQLDGFVLSVRVVFYGFAVCNV